MTLGLCLVLGLPAALLPTAGGAPADLPPERQVLILSRALAYDANLKDRAGGDLTVGILSRPGHSDSEAVAASMTRAWKAMGSIKVQGLPVRTVALPFSGGGPLGAALATEKVDALYVAPGLEGELAAVVSLTRQRRIVSMASREDQVSKGLALGVFNVDGKPTIVVNLPAARAEGAAFAADLLRLAKVIK